MTIERNDNELGRLLRVHYHAALDGVTVPEHLLHQALAETQPGRASRWTPVPSHRGAAQPLDCQFMHQLSQPVSRPAEAHQRCGLFIPGARYSYSMESVAIP